MRIEDLPNINGANFSGTFRVLSTHKRTAKSGTDFVHAELADTSGSIRA